MLHFFPWQLERIGIVPSKQNFRFIYYVFIYLFIKDYILLVIQDKNSFILLFTFILFSMLTCCLWYSIQLLFSIFNQLSVNRPLREWLANRTRASNGNGNGREGRRRHRSSTTSTSDRQNYNQLHHSHSPAATQDAIRKATPDTSKKQQNSAFSSLIQVINWMNIMILFSFITVHLLLGFHRSKHCCTYCCL